MSGLVDWDFAVTLGAKVAGDGPEVTADDAAAAVAELRAGADRSTGLVRDFTGLVAAEHTAPVLVVDRRGWVQANADGFAKIIEPLIARLDGQEGHAVRPLARDRLPRHRRRGRAAARLPRHQGARPVRPVPRPVGPTAARRAQHRPRRARDRRRPERLPPVGLPARGDPPRAVHGRAVDARPPLLRDDGPDRERRAHPARRGRRAPRLRGRPRRWRQPDGRHEHPRAARDPRPDHRRDVAARGPRRRRDGRRRPDRDPVGRRRSGSRSTSAARASAPSTASCAACSASTPRWRSTATAPRS